MHCFTTKSGFCVQVLIACSFVTSTANGQSYHGILINGQQGTQLYDPFNTPHAQGNLQLGLQTGNAAQHGAAVINGQLAYFASGVAGTFWYHKCGRTCFAGTSFLVYDSATNTTRTLAPMPVTTRVGRKLGDSDESDFMTPVKQNFKNSTPPTMPTRNGYRDMPMAWLCLEVMCSCAAGTMAVHYQSSCVQYNASINMWATIIPPLPVAIGYFPMITLRGRPYVFGGCEWQQHIEHRLHIRYIKRVECAHANGAGIVRSHGCRTRHEHGACVRRVQWIWCCTIGMFFIRGGEWCVVCGGAVEHGTLRARHGRIQRCAHCIICTHYPVWEYRSRARLWRSRQRGQHIGNSGNVVDWRADLGDTADANVQSRLLFCIRGVAVIYLINFNSDYVLL